jgi:hypothetical protein
VVTRFNEVFFQDYLVPDDMMVGAEGQGWAMVTGELAFERSGPDRFLSDYRLLVGLIDRVGPQPNPQQTVEIGRSSRISQRCSACLPPLQVFWIRARARTPKRRW